MCSEEFSWDAQSPNEMAFVDAIIRDLARVEWAQPLLADIKRLCPLARTNSKDLLALKAKSFELRFGYSLHQASIAPRYEAPGEAESTLDFGFTYGGNNWLVELMRLGETKAVRDATMTGVDEDGNGRASLHLYTDAGDLRQSIEGETLKAVGRICAHCSRSSEDRPHKFPALDGSLRVLLVDFRTFVDGGGVNDLIHVGLGGEYVQDSVPRLKWRGRLISGVFNERNELRGAVHVRERVHFLGIVRETAFEEGAFGKGTHFIANPHLFSTNADIWAAIRTWPLQPVAVLNG